MKVRGRRSEVVRGGGCPGVRGVVCGVRGVVLRDALGRAHVPLCTLTRRAVLAARAHPGAHKCAWLM